MLRRPAACDRRGRVGDARRGPGAVPGQGDPAPALRLPRLRKRRGAGAGTGTAADGGIATEALLAQVLVAKYSDHLPLYRQAQIFARHGIDLDRSTLATWVGRACWWLRPLAELLLGTILSSPKIFADDTPVPVLDPGRGRTKTGRLWAYARDDRPWGGPDPPAVAYVYSENRQGAHPRNHLAEFAGILQVDGYTGFDRIAGDRPKGAVKLAFCWAHVRRKFYDFHHATGSPIAAEALRRIAEIYAIEARIRGRPPDERRRIRQAETKPLVEATEDLARSGARTDIGQIGAGRRHPLRAAALGRARPVSRGRPRRGGYKHRRADHPATQARLQKSLVRRLRRRCRKLGDPRFADPDGKTQQRRAVRLSARCARTHRLRQDQGHRPRLAASLEMESLTGSASSQQLRAWGGGDAYQISGLFALQMIGTAQSMASKSRFTRRAAVKVQQSCTPDL